MRFSGSLLGVGLVVVLTGLTIWSAAHGVLIGVILAAPPAVLFAAALVDNRFLYHRKGDAEAGTPGEPAPPGGSA